MAPEELSELEIFHQRIRSFAKNLGYKEIATNSLLSKKEADILAERDLQIDTLNPVSQENTTLRTHLEGGFLKSLRYNLNRNARTLRFFELGHIFRKSENGNWVNGVEENVHLLMGLCGLKKDADWQGEPVPFTVFDLKADIEALFQNLGIQIQMKREAEGNHRLNYLLNEKTVCTLKRVEDITLKGFDVESDAYLAEINLTFLYDQNLVKTDIRYTPVPKFPVFEFDAAFTVDKSVRSGDMAETIRREAGTILKTVSVFDVYEGENIGQDKKSIAFRLTFLDSNKTLNIKDVEPIVQKIVQSLEKSTGAKLRS